MAPAERVGWEDFPRRLLDAGRQLGLSIEPGQLRRLLDYLVCLERWNSVYSLSAWKSASDLLVQHVFDSLTLVGPLNRYFTARALQVLDAGSGPGFPAAVVATMRADWTVTAVDAVGKKVAFIRQAAAEAGLSNLVASHARLEDLKPGAGYDVVVSRAFASLDRLAAMTNHLLKPDGIWIAQKGRSPDEEIAHLREGLRVFHVEPVTVPELNVRRHLVWMSRVVR